MVPSSMTTFSDRPLTIIWVYCIFFLFFSGLSSRAIAADKSPKLSAKAYLVLHNKTGKVLLSKNASDVRSIASLTKLQAALVVRRKGIDLSKKGAMVINRDDHRVAVKGARTRLELNWTYYNLDLMHAALIASDNRATSALGRAVKLSANGLVQAMNELARAQGLHHTVFKGPVGIDHGNKSNCWDVAKIVRQTSKDKILRKIMSKKTYTVKPKRGYLRVHYRNTNSLVSQYRFLASKTGYNDKADYCVAAVIKLPKIGEITLVILGSKTKLDRIRDQRLVIKHLLNRGKKLLKKLP